MQRPSLWMMIVVLLLGLLFLREPRLQHSEEYFLRWILKNSRSSGPAAPLTVVEIGRDPVLTSKGAAADPTEKFLHGPGTSISALEYALFLQAALEFKPTVIAFEPILKFRAHEKDQEQVFIDQAMRVPKLLLAAELTATPDPDAPVPEIPGFTKVSGRRGVIPDGRGNRGRGGNYSRAEIETFAIDPAGAVVCSRDARFAVCPIGVYSVCPSPVEIERTTTSPVFTPTRACSGNRPSCLMRSE